MTLKMKGSWAPLFFVFVFLITSVGLITAASPDVFFKESPKLASSVNGISTDTPYIKNYLSLYNNFSGVKYEKVPPNSAVTERLTVENKADNIKGFEAGNKRYAVHLLICNHNRKVCAFRVNGVPTGELAAANDLTAKTPSSFNLDENYTLQVDGIQLDYCDDRRFCNVHYEAYDIVNVSVLSR